MDFEKVIDSIENKILTWNGNDFPNFVKSFSNDELCYMREYLSDVWNVSTNTNQEHIIEDFITHNLMDDIREGIILNIDKKINAWKSINSKYKN